MPRIYHFLTFWVLRETLHSAPKSLIFGRLLRDTNQSGALWALWKWQNVPNLSISRHIGEGIDREIGQWHDWIFQVWFKSDWLILKTDSDLNSGPNWQWGWNSHHYCSHDWIFQVWFKSDQLILKTDSDLNDISNLNEIWILKCSSANLIRYVMKGI